MEHGAEAARYRFAARFGCLLHRFFAAELRPHARTFGDVGEAMAHGDHRDLPYPGQVLESFANHGLRYGTVARARPRGKVWLHEASGPVCYSRAP